MLKQVAEDIKGLRIQGATNIAYAGLAAMRHVINKFSTKNRRAFFKELIRAKEILFNARPNEPMMYNAINYLISRLKSFDGDFKSEGLRLIDYIENKFNSSKKLAKFSLLVSRSS